MTDPEKIPDLEPGGEVSPGSTPPAEGQTSGLSSPEPSAGSRFSAIGTLSVAAVIAIVVVFGAAAIAIIVFAFSR